MGKRERTGVPYFGSVRFFRHLILGTVATLILVPTVLCVVFAGKYLGLKASAGWVAPPASEAEHPEPSPKPEPTPATPVLAGESPQWQNLYPALYAAPARRSSVDDPKVCYLTFDDGPSPRTPEILAILERYNVKATFFVVGKTDEQSKQWMRDIVAAGHTLGMHSYTHDYKDIYASVEAFLEDYNQIYQLIYEATGVYPQISRFPGGSINGYNGGAYADMISELVRRGFVYFDWNVSTEDAAGGYGSSAEALARNALDRADSLRRAVVLMHDSADKKATVEALPAIIEGYQEAGFTLEALTPEVVPVVYTYPS